MNKLFFYIFITMLALTFGLWTDPPIPPGDPFLFMWNSPTENCERAYGVKLDLSLFPIISTTVASAKNLTISMFYHHRFGVYPETKPVKNGSVIIDTITSHGGVPQEINMTEHLIIGTANILEYMPSDIPGLGVFDFEEWRPLWIRNWGDKDAYRIVSKELVEESNSSLKDSQVTIEAREDWNEAAKTYFTETIRLGKKLRPKKLWGFYLFPECYNHDMRDPNYNGECADKELKRNDKLRWLWEESTALFPSIYVTKKLYGKPTHVTKVFIRHRVQEAIRVSTQTKKSANYSIPIHAYIRTVNKDMTHDFLDEPHLVVTIGEAVALGAASVISWADIPFSSTSEKCIQIQKHLDNVVNPYVLNVSTATRLCSEGLCQGRGRCLRKNWTNDIYLHLDPSRYQIVRVGKTDSYLTVTGSLSQEDVNYFDRWFDCMCFSEEPCRSAKTVSNNTGPIGPHPVLLMLSLISLIYVMMCM